MPVFLTVDDLEAFYPGMDPDRAQAMIDDATALALLAAPCLGDPDTVLTPEQLAAIKAVLRAAILRWHDTGSGVVSTQTAGPFGQVVDTRQPRRGMFWPSEISDLQRFCADGTAGAAFQIDTMPNSAYWSGRWMGPDLWVPYWPPVN